MRGYRGGIVTACSIDSCTNKHYAKGWCRRHYNLAKRNDGNPIPRYEIIQIQHRYNDEGLRICSECREFLPVESFGKSTYRDGKDGQYRSSGASKDGLKTVCKKCTRKRGLLSRYGLTPEQRDEMFSQQNGLCAICKKRPARVVDHDHSCCNPEITKRAACGKCTRGLLCNTCNPALGSLEDDGFLKNALAYLASHGKVLM